MYQDQDDYQVAAAKTGAPVLVVEDNAINKMLFEAYLKKLGYSVLTADNGREALELMQQQPVALVLMDCQMPVMDGFEAASHIRAMPGPGSRVPIVAVTANAIDLYRERCRQAGMNGFLAKPLSMATLKKTLRELLPA